MDIPAHMVGPGGEGRPVSVPSAPGQEVQPPGPQWRGPGGHDHGRRHSGAIVSLVDRASKFTLLQLFDRKTAAEVSAAMIDCLGPVSDLVLTVTADNGREFAGHAEMPGVLGADFASPAPITRWSGV